MCVSVSLARSIMGPCREGRVGYLPTIITMDKSDCEGQGAKGPNSLSS